MKLLVSDYDGTIKTFQNNPSFYENIVFKKNLQFIKRFIEHDNIFMISTGRNLSSILKEMNKYNIIYDYLSAFNGRVIYTKNNGIIYANYINNNIINKILNNNIIKKAYLLNSYGEESNKENIVYLKIILNTYKDIKEYILEWKKTYPNLKIDYNIIFNSIYIRNEFNKSLGIKKLLEIENLDIEKENIITIGDGENDLEMIKDYNGYRMLISNYKLISATSNVTSSVHKLIKKNYI